MEICQVTSELKEFYNDNHTTVASSSDTNNPVLKNLLAQAQKILSAATNSDFDEESLTKFFAFIKTNVVQPSITSLDRVNDLDEVSRFSINVLEEIVDQQKHQGRQASFLLLTADHAIDLITEVLTTAPKLWGRLEEEWSHILRALFDFLTSPKAINTIVDCFSYITTTASNITLTPSLKKMTYQSFKNLCTIPIASDTLISMTATRFTPDGVRVNVTKVSYACNIDNPQRFAFVLAKSLPFAMETRDTSLVNLITYIMSDPEGLALFIGSWGKKNQQEVSDASHHQNTVTVFSTNTNNTVGGLPAYGYQNNESLGAAPSSLGDSGPNTPSSSSSSSNNNNTVQGGENNNNNTPIGLILDLGVAKIKPGQGCVSFLRALLQDVFASNILKTKHGQNAFFKSVKKNTILTTVLASSPSTSANNSFTSPTSATSNHQAPPAHAPVKLLLTPLKNCQDGIVHEELSPSHNVHLESSNIINAIGTFLNEITTKFPPCFTRRFFLVDEHDAYFSQNGFFTQQQQQQTQNHQQQQGSPLVAADHSRNSNKSNNTSYRSSNTSNHHNHNNNSNGSFSSSFSSSSVASEDPFETLHTVTKTFKLLLKLEELESIKLYLATFANVIAVFGCAASPNTTTAAVIRRSNNNNSQPPSYQNSNNTTPSKKNQNQLLQFDHTTQGVVIHDDADQQQQQEHANGNDDEDSTNLHLAPPHRDYDLNIADEQSREAFLYRFFKTHSLETWKHIVGSMFSLERPAHDAAIAFSKFLIRSCNHSVSAQGSLACHKMMNCLLMYFNGIIDAYLDRFSPAAIAAAKKNKANNNNQKNNNNSALSEEDEGHQVVKTVTVMVEALLAYFRGYPKPKRVFCELFMNDSKEAFLTSFVLLEKMSQICAVNVLNPDYFNDSCTLFEKLSLVFAQLLFFNRYSNNSNNHGLQGTSYCGHHRKTYNSHSESVFIQMKRTFITGEEGKFVTKFKYLGDCYFGGSEYKKALDYVKDYQKDSRM